MEALFQPRLARCAKLHKVSIQQRLQLRGDGNLLGRASQLLEDILQPAPIVIQQQCLCHRQRFHGRLRGYKRIPITIASDP